MAGVVDLRKFWQSSMLKAGWNAENIAEERGVDVIALDDALNALAQFDERKSRIVDLHFFGGLSEAEISEVLKVALRTVQRK